jgi:mediator of RNA polymerase II transcription subunit 5
MRNMCALKETGSLKSLCSSLARKPRALDIVLQYVSPNILLQPLCQLLNEWKYEEDQGKFGWIPDTARH